MEVANNAQHYKLRSNVRESARDVLFQLYEYLGRPPFENFYPVKLKDIINSILGWNLQEIPSIGQARYGDVFSSEPVLGKIDLEKKLITINMGDTSEEVRNYTLAHEIGHLVLHQTTISCRGGSALRKRSVRRLKFENRDEFALKQEREADIFASELLMPEKAVRKQFNTTFSRKAIRAQSTFVLKLYERQISDSFSRRPSIDQSNPLAVARYLATFKPDPNVISLTEFFDVSREAMSFRLVELELVF